MADVAACGGSGACPINEILPPMAEMGSISVLGSMIPSPWGAQVQDKRHCALRIYQGHVASAGYWDYGTWNGPAVMLCPGSINHGRHRRPGGEGAPMAPVGLAVAAEVHRGLADLPRADIKAITDRGATLRAPGAA